MAKPVKHIQRNNKKRGYALEAKVVEMARERGLEARRAWGSNGQAIGLPATVDVEVAGRYFQCKKRKALADYVRPAKACHGQIIEQDYGQPLVVLPLSDYLEMMNGNREEMEG